MLLKRIPKLETYMPRVVTREVRGRQEERERDRGREELDSLVICKQIDNYYTDG